jgi:hypothetical protein
MAKRTRVLLPSEERRHFPRYQIHHGKEPHLVAHLQDVDRYPAHILDLSRGGISLFCDHHLNPGDVVTLNLHHIPRRFVCDVSVRILLAKEFLGAFLLGASFTRELTDAEMEGLL